MSAAHTMPQQPMLDGIPAALPTSAVVPELRTALNGTLAQPALVRVHANGAVDVEVLIAQQVAHHPRALPVFGAFRYPDQGCADATLRGAQRKAAQMPAGSEVMLLCRGLELGRHDARDVFRAMHVDALDVTHHINHP